ncbi:FHA domain-containing protein [Myxococcota bacterium]
MVYHAGMPDQQGKRPPPTRAIEYGQELPKPSVSDLYGKSDPLPKNTSVRLSMEAGPRAPEVVEVDKSVVVLGRGEGIADVEVGDESASRRHAYIIHREGEFFLNDMGSTNGTVLNGALVGEARLKDGDHIQIGTAVMRFEVSR